MVKGTCAENFSAVHDGKELVEELKKINREIQTGAVRIPIDNYFNVKGVGTVVLGIIKSGTIKKYDRVVIEPPGKEAVVKGLQSQDKDIDSANAGMRVGINLKGIEDSEIRRGYAIGSFTKSKSFKLYFQKSRYSKENLKENDQIFISSGLQVAAAKIKSVSKDMIEVAAETTVAYTEDTKFLLASAKQQLPRIIGRASLKTWW